jgi:RNA polymerase sigma-70 factor (ECF subfamily)
VDAHVGNLARDAVETAARQSYGRLVAFLAARSRDVAGAEDALADAFAAAIETWPRTGIPEKPEAWLLVAARRRLSHGARHRNVVAAAEPRLLLAIEEAEQIMSERSEALFPDDRLKLLFVCAHPAIDPAAHTPLMLQTVVGLDAARIASAFLVSPAAMSQRLVRAKSRIRDLGIAFEIPDTDALPGRLPAVLDAIYASFGAGWNDGEDHAGMTSEAIFLARTLVALSPDEPEAHGLLALMLHAEARAAARRSPDGAFVPLDEQDCTLWDGAMMREADTHLILAGRMSRFGRYQCEAAIQSVHAERARSGVTNWAALATLYAALVRLSPSLGAAISHAAVVVRTSGHADALGMLDGLDPARVNAYQPYWAVRASVLRGLGRLDEASSAYEVAAGMTRDQAVRLYLLAQRQPMLRDAPDPKA